MILSPFFENTGSTISGNTSMLRTLLLLPNMHLNRVATVTKRSLRRNLKNSKQNF